MGNELVSFLASKRYLLLYIIFGIISLIVQFIVNYVLYYFLDLEIYYLGVICSIFTAFYLNVRYNFYIKKRLLIRALILFFIVSNISYFIQEYIKTFLDIPYFQSMFLVSGSTFWIFYLIHKLSSFKSRTQIGVAIHLSKKEKLENIYEEIINFPDFVHIDLISDDYNNQNIATEISLISKIEKLWPKKPKQVHLMTNNPFEYIQKIANEKYTYFIDVNFIYEYIINADKLSNFKIGFTILINSSTEEINKAIELGNELLILCIDKPGFSGQIFSQNAYELIDYIDKNNKGSEVTIDGGVNIDIVKNTNFVKYASASHILTSLHPAGKIFDMRNAKKYEV